MNLTTRSRYGLRMLLDIALHCGDGPVCIQDIADRRNISVKYLEKLIRPLKRAGMVQSKRGPKGGHLLAKPPEEITVGQVVLALEAKKALSDCLSNPEACNIAASCVTRKLWKKATDSLYAMLDDIRLSDLIADAQATEDMGLPCC